MPLPLLAHQAPVLPLKLWRPLAFNGTALVLGSLAPDLEYLRAYDPHADRGFAHSWAGQFLFCVPFTLSVVLVIGRLGLGEVLAARFGARLAWLARAATDVKNPGGFVRACISALVGSLSHIAFDALTHRLLPRWMPSGMFHVSHIRFAASTLAQLVASVVGAIVSLWLLRRIAQRTVNETPARRPGAPVVVLLGLVGAGLGLLRARPAIRDPDSYFDAGGLYIFGDVAFLMACGAGAGVLLAALILAAWDQRAPMEASRSR